MSTETRLKGIDNIGDTLLSKTLEVNAVSFFQWGFLCVGGFFNVTIPTTGAYGGNQHRLRLVKEDSNYTNGQVWEGFRSDWVWETGVEYDYQPIQVSGVYVNGNFYSTTSTTGTYAHHIDYPAGRVVFDSAIGLTSVVTCEFSYRYVHFTHGSVPWWRQVQTRSMRVDSADFLQQGSGEWSILSQNRIQLPAVIVEAAPRTRRRPFEIGSIGATVSQDVLFHILTETPDEAKLLHDTITNQWQKRFYGFNLDYASEHGKFPLNADGSPNPSGLMFPQLTAPTGNGGCRWRQLRIEGMQSVDNGNPLSLWTSTVRGTFEVDLP